MNLELVMCLAGNLFGIYIISRFFSIFFEIEGTQKRKGLRFFCYAFYYALNSMVSFYFHGPPSFIILSNIFGCLLVSWSYKGSWKHRICAVMLILAVGIACEDTVYYYLRNLHIEYLRIICILVTNILSFMIVLLLQKAVDLRHGKEFTLLEWVAVIVIPVCSLLVSIVALDDCKDEITVVIGGISIILINVLLFFLLDRIQEMYRSQLNLALLEQQNQAYESQMDLLRDSEEKISALRHDLKNHFFVLNQMAEQNQCEEITRYIQDLQTLDEARAKMVSTGNPVIDGFVNLKLNEAAALGSDIKIELNISENMPITAKSLIIILGNLLDNALRALSLCDTGRRLLNIRMRQERGILLIEVTNSYNGMIQKVGTALRTTKATKEGHGIGLKNVQRVVDEYHGQMEIDYTEDLFSVRLVVFL